MPVWVDDTSLEENVGDRRRFAASAKFKLVPGHRAARPCIHVSVKLDLTVVDAIYDCRAVETITWSSGPTTGPNICFERKSRRKNLVGHACATKSRPRD